tara:strand:- start:6260 stop:6427 length:168 start_codon:yes stop_codon:yes gene_type:complete
MVELLQLLEAGLVFTAVSIAAVSAPVSLLTDAELPDIAPLIEQEQQTPPKQEEDD